MTTLSDRTLDLLVRDRTRFGAGTIDDLASTVRQIGGGPDARVFIVSDPGVVASGVTATVAGILAEDGIETTTFGDVEANPGMSVVERGGAELRTFGLDDVIVVAVGGGSTMDTAKALSLYATNDVGVAELGYENEDLAPGRPIVAVPTTAGTGAETNIYGVITDDVSGRKSYIGHRSVMPRACILDPELTFGLPPAATAATGIDALTHAIESLLSKNPNPLAEAIALGVIRTVGEWLPRAVKDGSDVEARSQLLLASHLAGLGQASGTGVGLVHALGHAIGARGRQPHGTALAAVLAEVLAFDLEVRTRELALLGIALGAASPTDRPGNAAHSAVAAVKALIRSVDQRRTLRELGIDAAMLPIIVRDALDDPAINNTPRMPTEAEATAILAAVAG
jgi:alcohol dehydrogenase